MRSAWFVIVLVALLAVGGGSAAIAHPGGTASDGCHYCRTNCDRWGEEHGRRHCHDEEGIAWKSWAVVAGVGGLVIVGSRWKDR